MKLFNKLFNNTFNKAFNKAFNKTFNKVNKTYLCIGVILIVILYFYSNYFGYNKNIIEGGIFSDVDSDFHSQLHNIDSDAHSKLHNIDSDARSQLQNMDSDAHSQLHNIDSNISSNSNSSSNSSSSSNKSELAIQKAIGGYNTSKKMLIQELTTGTSDSQISKILNELAMVDKALQYLQGNSSSSSSSGISSMASKATSWM